MNAASSAFAFRMIFFLHFSDEQKMCSFDLFIRQEVDLVGVSAAGNGPDVNRIYDCVRGMQLGFSMTALISSRCCLWERLIHVGYTFDCGH